MFDEIIKRSKKQIVDMFPDRLFAEYAYYKSFGKRLNLKDPKTFDEKLQWLKLYDRKPIYSQMVDKYEAKKYVSDILGKQYIIPTYGVWEKFSDIDFDILPKQFVLKCTHDSGGLVIVTDKDKFDKDEAEIKISKSLNRNFYKEIREWPYKNIKPRVLAEKYMEDTADKELRDYKFYCFNGKPQRLLLATNRQSIEKELSFDYFDMDFTHLDLTNHWHPRAETVPHIPKCFEEMKILAGKLSSGIPHVRVDFYEVDGRVYFGELTFYDMGGFLELHPEEWAEEWGSFIQLPTKKRHFL